MSNQSNDNAADDWSRAPNEPRQPNRMGQIIQRVLIQGTEAQRSTTRNLEKNGRVMLWSAVLAAISTVISAAGFIFVVVYLLRTPH
jgi:hypothetical protein